VTKLQSTLYSKFVIVKKDQRLPAVEHRVLGEQLDLREKDREAGEICKIKILIFNKYFGVINRRMIMGRQCSM
jgi:hypothetical protein